MKQDLDLLERDESNELQQVEDACIALRRGDLVVLRGADGQGAVMAAAETVGDDSCERLFQIASARPLLLLTARRAAALDIEGDVLDSTAGVVAVKPDGCDRRQLAALSDPTFDAEGAGGGPLPPVELAAAPIGLDLAAIDLTKLAKLLPAALLAPLEGERGSAVDAVAARLALPLVTDRQVADYRFATVRSLTRVSEAQVPLEGAEQTKVVAFRPRHGGVEQLALVIGDPQPDQPVLVRLHSECFTGDLLGSLRCDCGDQLRGAISAIAEAGAGILLYLNQEGRGIGLVNKLRAYRLQDGGADTAEANEQLGFDADERVYLPAAEMLRQLGFQKVRLLTNNPQKVAALTRCGIAVEERVPHSFPSNDHNAFYLQTKASRFGHMF